MRQKGVRVASGRRQDDLASGWRQDDVKRRGARINCCSSPGPDLGIGHFDPWNRRGFGLRQVRKSAFPML